MSAPSMFGSGATTDAYYNDRDKDDIVPAAELLEADLHVLPRM